MMRILIQGIFILCGIGVFFSFSYATPHYSILVDESGTGSRQFAQELSRLWEVPTFKMESSLAPVFEREPQMRLQRLRSRQGDFAILPPQNAYPLLPKNLEIAVISVLWPNVLHVLTRLPEVVELDSGISSSFYINKNSDYFAVAWHSTMTLAQENSSPFHWVTTEKQKSVFSRKEEMIILTAPYPIGEIDHLLGNATYRLIPLSEELQRSNLEYYPWITSRLLPNNIYPAVQPMNLLTSYPVLVARADTSSTLIRSILKILFSQQNVIRPHPLFRFLNPKANEFFKKNYRFHSASRRFFKW